MSLTPVLVTIQKPVRAGDGGGGKTITWTTTATAYATQNFYTSLRRSELLTLETGQSNTGGPGLQIDKMQLFVFETPPLPTVKTGYRIVSPDGNIYTVKFARPYDATNLQVDAELVGTQ